jgi:hypothetical protein
MSSGAGTIPPEPWRRLAMTSQPQPPAWSNRLADQLQVLSEVAESLAYRLLDLEERLVAQEQEADAVDPLVAEEMELRLLDTEERLTRIEGLLAPGERASEGRQRQPLRLASPHAQALVGARQMSAPRPMEEDLPLEEEPFLDEGEQLFMDELTA